MELTLDMLNYIAEVGKMLKNVPNGKLEYGEFHIGEVTLCFDGDQFGSLVEDDPAFWTFRSDEKYWGAVPLVTVAIGDDPIEEKAAF